MVKDKINKKYGIWIWLALIFSSFVKNAYSLYVTFSTAGFNNVGEILVNVFLNILLTGILPAVLCYLCASIMHSIAWRRNLRFISRNDFIHIVMIFGAAEKFIVGIISVFGIILPSISVYSSAFMDEIVLTCALYIMFFLILVPKYDVNPKAKSAAFSSWAWIYLLFLGLDTVPSAFTLLICYANPETTEQLLKNLQESMGIAVKLDSDLLAASIAAIVIFVVILVITVVVGAILRKKAKGYIEPEPEVAANPFVQNAPFNGNPFDEFADGKSFDGGSGADGKADDGNDKVFDEFDI